MLIIPNIKLIESKINDGATENQVSCMGWDIIYQFFDLKDQKDSAVNLNLNLRCFISKHE